MTILFDRKITVIAQNETFDDLTIQNLRIQFDIEKFFTHVFNVGTITIYNLNPINRGLLVKRKSDLESAPFTTITVIAGYADSQSMIFRGQLVQGFSVKKGPDWITTLQCTTAFDQYISAHHGVGDTYEEITAFDLLSRLLNITFTELALINTFTRDLEFGYALNMDSAEVERMKRERIIGNAFSGRVMDSIVTILNRFNLKISVDDIEILIAKEYAPVNPDDKDIAPLINIQSGMINSPQITDVGVKLTTLLNPDIRVAKLFRVQSETTKQNDINEQEIQTFTCTKLKHSGDTHGDDWASEILGAWFPELDFTGTKNVEPEPFEEPQLQLEILTPPPPPRPGEHQEDLPEQTIGPRG